MACFSPSKAVLSQEKGVSVSQALQKAIIAAAGTIKGC